MQDPVLHSKLKQHSYGQVSRVELNSVRHVKSLTTQLMSRVGRIRAGLEEILDDDQGCFLGSQQIQRWAHLVWSLRSPEWHCCPADSKLIRLKPETLHNSKGLCLAKLAPVHSKISWLMQRKGVSTGVTCTRLGYPKAAQTLEHLHSSFFYLKKQQCHSAW